MKKKILSAVMVLAMVLSLLPISALAEEPKVAEVTINETTTTHTQAELNAMVSSGGALVTDGDAATPGTNDYTKTITIKLLDNVTMEPFKLGEYIGLTIDLNGHTYTQNCGATSSTKNGLVLQLNDTLTVEDSSQAKTGVLCGEVQYKGGAVIYANGSSQTINLKSGTVEATCSKSEKFYAINSFSGTFSMTGGAVKAQAGSTYGTPIAVSGNNMSISTGTLFAGGTADIDNKKGIALEVKGNNVTISGGTFQGTKYSVDTSNPIKVSGGMFDNIDASDSGCSGSSFSNCTINGTLTLGSNECNFDDVTFGTGAQLSSTLYKLANGQVVSTNAPEITFATNDAAMGLIKIDSYEFSNPPSRGGYNNPMESWTWYVNSGSEASVTATAVPADENHEFVGWYDTANGNGTLHSTNAQLPFTSEGVTKDVTYYAVFKETEKYANMKTAAEEWASGESLTISNITEMDYFAYAVNELGMDFSDKTVTLSASLTYTDTDSFTPIGTADNHFKGTFVGSSNTISGLSAVGTYSMSGTGSYLGLFGYTSGAVIKDLTLSGVDFYGAYMAGGFVGEANSTTFTNCTLTGGSKVSNAYYTGGLFGHSSGGCTVTGCKVENSALDGNWKTGGITGYADGVRISDTAVNNTAVKGTGVGALIGHANAGNTALTNVTVADVTDGEQKKINVIGTTYEGGDSHSITVSGDNTNIDAAGIVPSGSKASIQVTGGDFTFEIPEEYIPNDESSNKISVIFTSDDEIVIVQVIEAGETVTLPTAPSKNGYTFQGWYLEDGTKVTGKTEFTENTTVSAKWQVNSTPSTPSDNSDNSDPTYSISLPSKVTGGEISLQKRYAEKGETVTITVTPDDGYELDELIVTDSKGNELDLTAKGSGKYTFKMPAGGVEIEASFRKIVVVPVNPFADVNTGDYYFDAVLWAVDNGITSGTSATTFSPNAVCTRAQMMTYLWRAAGSPRASAANPFTDLSAGDYYYDAVLWAVEKGITGGTSATTFSPDAPVTRGQTMTFLWRAAGSPVVSGSSFGDVAAEAYYADAVTWAVREGITAGTGPSTFSPDQGCTRAQTVTYLYARYGA